jgi:hypothetical protein
MIMGIYKNIYRMPIHVPFGDINGGSMVIENEQLIIDYYGDGQSIEIFNDFDTDTREKILKEWLEYTAETRNF